MPNEVMAFRNGGGLPSLATVPMETTMAGQPHRLAYVNPIEEEMMKQMGGAGLPGPGGIPSYFIHKPNSFIRRAFTGDSDKTDDDKVIETATNKDKPGFVDSILMGIGVKDKTPGYYAATANSIARTQGSDAANRYISGLVEDLPNQGSLIAQNTFDALNAASDTIQASGASFDNAQSSGGGSGATTATAVADTTADTSADTTADTTTAFVMNEDQKAAALGALNRINENALAITQGRSFDELSIGERQALIRGNAPTATELSDILGIDFEIAQSILQTPGGGSDLRNWSSILSAEDPLAATRAATAALYSIENLSGIGPQPDFGYATDALASNIGEILAESGPFVLYNTGQGANQTAQDLGLTGNIRLGVLNPVGNDQRALITSYNLGTADDNLNEILARFGGSSQGILDLLPTLEDYYSQNVTLPETTYTQVVKETNPFGDVSYYDRSGRRYAGDLSDRIITQDGKTFLMSPQYDASDPFGYISSLQTAAENTMFGGSPDATLGQNFLYTGDVGLLGASAPRFNFTQAEINDMLAEQDAVAKQAAFNASLPSSGQPNMNVLDTPVSNPMVNYSAIVPAPGTSTAGIVGLPSTGLNTATNNPYTFTAYTPGTYNPVVNPLVLPPLG